MVTTSGTLRSVTARSVALLALVVGLLVMTTGPAGAQGGGDDTSGAKTAEATTTVQRASSSTSSAPSSTTTEATTTTTEAVTTTTATEPVTTTTLRPTTTTEAVFEEEPVEEEEVEEVVEETVEEPATTETTARPTTTTATTAASIPGPRSSILGPTEAPATTSPSDVDDDTQRVVWLVVAVLVVIGLLIAVLTWRYWWYTNPARGYVKSRAVFSPAPLRDEGEVVQVWRDGVSVEPPDVPVPGAPAPSVTDGALAERPRATVPRIGDEADDEPR